jgi:NADPH:quinone reductase-like Zn-dependent oxidoreductase
MRALVNTRHGPPEVLQVLEREDPVPTGDSLRVRVARAGLNFADIQARMGLYPDAPPTPSVVGYEVAGVVDALGPEVKGFTVGQRVIAFTRFGGQATLALTRAGWARALPDAVDFDTAAATPVVYGTAFHILHHVAALRPGLRILIHAAAGGVGLAALDLCRGVRDLTIFGTASASKHEALRAQGVAHCIDYNTQDWVAEVKRLTDGEGVDLILDAQGGTSWGKSLQVLGPGGHLVCYGVASAVGQTRSLLTVGRQLLGLKWFNPLGLMAANHSVSGVNMLNLFDAPRLIGPMFDTLLAQIAAGTLKPRVDKVFALSDAASAHRYVQERRNVGKVIFDCER